MIALDEFIQLIEMQFGSYLFGKSYETAFNESIGIIKQLSVKKDDKSKQDVFYLFLHSLIIEIFNRLDRLEKIIQQKDS